MLKKQITLLLGICLSTALYAQETLKIEAESLTEKSEKVTTNTRKTGETIVGSFDKGKWIKFENIDFGKGRKTIKVRAASGTSSKKANLEIRLGSKDGQVIGKVQVPVKGWNTYTETETELSKKVSKKQDVYIFSLKGGVILDWVEFAK